MCHVHLNLFELVYGAVLRFCRSVRMDLSVFHALIHNAEANSLKA